MCSPCTAIGMEYSEALNWLYSQKKTHKREDLSRIKRCIHLLHIQTDYQIIHIAGTNGKGSVASYLNQMCMLYGKKVGMFVSPFVVSYNERIEVNQTYISDEKVVEYIHKLKLFSEEYSNEYDDTIPFFELTFLMALLYFQEQNIEVLILECGLGGLLDATNALDKDVAIITNIGYDHMKELGPTLEDIAMHKLGITRENKLCLTSVDEKLFPLFQGYAEEHHFPLIYTKPEVKHIEIKENATEFTYKDVVYQTALRGVFQAYNAALAIETIQRVYRSYPNELIQKALLQTTWPGRFERVQSNVILDGAHNLPGMEALVETLVCAYPNQRIKIVFTALKDKAINDMLHKLDKVAVQYYFTTISDRRASTIEDITVNTQKPFQWYENYIDAVKMALSELKSNELLVITGSLHFISEVRKLFVEKE